ncbi:hypothetical protein [Enterobacter cloacae]|uniref:hypothetical protein n=1 Tax=Enterobacter cloacae TaxID=550 RepID=UPI00200BD541|nr:hypothetical protein [Enterobacter cloacae]
MATLRCYWDGFFTTYGTVFTKTLLALLLIGWCYDVLRRRKKASHQTTGAIAEANAREREAWRYLRWSWKIVQVACLLSLFLLLVKAFLA